MRKSIIAGVAAAGLIGGACSGDSETPIEVNRIAFNETERPGELRLFAEAGDPVSVLSIPMSDTVIFKDLDEFTEGEDGTYRWRQSGEDIQVVRLAGRRCITARFPSDVKNIETLASTEGVTMFGLDNFDTALCSDQPNRIETIVAIRATQAD